MTQLTEQQETERGQLIADVLKLRRYPTERDRYATEWGSKTALGVFRTVKRIIEHGE